MQFQGLQLEIEPATFESPDQRFTDSATETVAVSMGASLVYTGPW